MTGRFSLVGGGLVASLAVLALISIVPASTVAGAAAEDGRAVFDGQKCATCHSVSSAGIEAKMKAGPMAGPDLTGVGERRDADWLAAYLKGEETIEGAKHKKPFKGTDDEMKLVVTWMLEQKAE